MGTVLDARSEPFIIYKQKNVNAMITLYLLKDIVRICAQIHKYLSMDDAVVHKAMDMELTIFVNPVQVDL